MSKKYDNNLQEIKNTIPIKTFSTNSMEIEEDKENSIYKLTTTFLTQFYDAKEKYLIDSLLQDMQENKEKYKGLTIIPVEREKIVELLNKGKEFDQLKQQLAEKDREIEELKKKGFAYLSTANVMRYELEGWRKYKKEKDKEIERLKVSENWYREQYNDICKRCEDYNKNLRHRVVEQFKEKYRNVANYLTGHCTEAQLIEVLDQIEKGTDNE